MIQIKNKSNLHILSFNFFLIIKNIMYTRLKPINETNDIIKSDDNLKLIKQREYLYNSNCLLSDVEKGKNL